MSQEKEALKVINEKISQAYGLIKECEKLAEKAGVEFSFDVAYGMGGTYIPQVVVDEEEHGEAGWNASSHSC